MIKRPLLALECGQAPLWESVSGDVFLSYSDPGALANRYGSRKRARSAARGRGHSRGGEGLSHRQRSRDAQRMVARRRSDVQ